MFFTFESESLRIRFVNSNTNPKIFQTQIQIELKKISNFESKPNTKFSNQFLLD